MMGMGRRRSRKHLPGSSGSQAAQPASCLRFHEDFPSTYLDNERTLIVYQPPGYELDSERRYPVLYLHDGQNLFDPRTAAFGVAWDSHRTADRLIAAGSLPPLLMVGIYNTSTRIDEYTWIDGGRDGGGKGKLYGRFLFEEVKPFIDATYRTLPGRMHTGVGGSSLGGLLSLTLAWQFPEFLSRCALLSPSLWWANGRILPDLEQDPGWMRSMRFWLDMGTREGANHSLYGAGLAHTRRLAECFRLAGLRPEIDFRYREIPDGEHCEAAWAARFDDVLLFLFGV
jgi:predicted alpha/beta superfamily hydrolase